MSLVVAVALALLVILLARRTEPDTARIIYWSVICAWTALVAAVPLAVTLVVMLWVTLVGGFMDFGIDMPMPSFMFSFERAFYQSDPLLFLLVWYPLLLLLPIAILFIALRRLPRWNNA